MEKYNLIYTHVQSGRTWGFKKMNILAHYKRVDRYEREDGKQFTVNNVRKDYEFIRDMKGRSRQVWVTNPVNGFKYRVIK